MDDSGYLIAPDKSRNLLHITLMGHWDQGTFDRFKEELRRHIRSLGAAAVKGEHVALVDTRTFPVQSKEVAERFTELATDPTIRSARTAMVMPGSLAKMQAARVAPGDQRHYFSSEEEAIEWLMLKED